MEQFPCSGCGQCCRKVGPAVVIARKLVVQGNTDNYVAAVAAFPYEWDAQGACEKLKSDNGCAVYENRPDICNVEAVWRKYHSFLLPKVTYFQSAAKLCNLMIEEAKMGDNFFIEVDGINC